MSALFVVAAPVHAEWSRALEAGDIPDRGVTVGEANELGVPHECPDGEREGHIEDLDAAIYAAYPE